MVLYCISLILRLRVWQWTRTQIETRCFIDYFSHYEGTWQIQLFESWLHEDLPSLRYKIVRWSSDSTIINCFCNISSFRGWHCSYFPPVSEGSSASRPTLLLDARVSWHRLWWPPWSLSHPTNRWRRHSTRWCPSSWHDCWVYGWWFINQQTSLEDQQWARYHWITGFRNGPKTRPPAISW